MDYDGKVKIATELDTKTVDAQIAKLEKDLSIMTKSLESDMKIPVELRMNENERLNLMNDIEKTKNRIISLKESAEDTGTQSNKMTNNISKGFKKGTGSLKKFALSLFGIHSIYRLVSRASSSYLSQDTELAERLQNVWIGLGSFLEPLLNTISNALLKGLGYLNVFVKALTGVDYIARANAKALNKQAEAQKKLNKATQDYDFDVIRKQQDLTSSSSSRSDYSGIEIPELDDKVVKKLQNLAKWLKENENLIKAVGIALGVTFGAIAIAKLLTNIGNLIGVAGTAGTGLAGLSSVLGVLGQIGIITIGVTLLYTGLTGRSLIDDLKEINRLSKELNETNEMLIETTKKNADATKEWAEKMKNNTDAIAEKTNPELNDLIDNLDNFCTSTNENINKLKEQDLQMATTAAEYQIASNRIDEQTYKLEGYKNILENVKTKLENENQELDKNSDKYKENNELLDKTKTALDKIDGYTAKSTAEVEVKATGDMNWFEKLWYQLKGSVKSIGSAFSSVYGSGKGYAAGGIVTQPTRALIGEAGYPEAIVPMNKDYLSTLASEIGKYSGGSGGGTVNVYLDGRLIQRQIQQVKDNKDFATNS